MSLLTLLMSARNPPGLPPTREGQAYYYVGPGDSLAIGYPHTPSQTKSFQKFTADKMGGVSFLATGIPAARTDEIRAAFNANCLDYLPSIVTIEGGVNDIAQGRSNSLIIADLQFMINACVDDGILVVYLPIIPWTNGTTPQNQAADMINTTMIAWMEANHPDHLVADARATLGQFRTGGDIGNLWDIKLEYDEDGVHLTEGGYQVWGDFIGDTIMAALT